LESDTSALFVVRKVVAKPAGSRSKCAARFFCLSRVAILLTFAVALIGVMVQAMLLAHVL